MFPSPAPASGLLWTGLISETQFTCVSSSVSTQQYQDRVLVAVHTVNIHKLLQSVYVHVMFLSLAENFKIKTL